MKRGSPSLTALLGLLAIAGYQNRDKLAEMFSGKSADKTGAPGQGDQPDRPPNDEPQIEQVFTYSDLDVLRQKDFATLDDEELATVKRLMLSLTWNLQPRRPRRTVGDPRGR